MKALVTGGTGFVGFNLVKRLREEGWEVLYTGRSGEQSMFELGEPLTGYVGEAFHTLDWSQIGKVDVVFHQAAITDTTVYDRKLMMDVNLYNSLALFDQAINHGCRQIVYASSCAVYGAAKPPFKDVATKELKPLNVYGESKLRLDCHAHCMACERNVNIVGLRYSNVYGPHESHKDKTMCMVSQIGRQMIDGPPKLFEWGEQKRDFVYVKDVVNYNMAAARFEGRGVFNAGSGIATSFNDVVAAFNEAYGKALEPIYMPNPYQDKYQDFTLCDISRTTENLGVFPEWSLREALSDADYLGDLHFSWGDAA